MTATTSSIKNIAFLGNYLPRKCGIATFTTDLRTAVANHSANPECSVIAINDIPTGYEYPGEVRFEIEEQDLSSYLKAADYLNISDIDALSLQHEFGIFGGVSGSHILTLLHKLRMPVITTLHTILHNPSPDQMRVMRELILLSTRLIVMTEKGLQLLKDIYQVPPSKIDLIPHGIPDEPFADSNQYKGEFGVAGKQVLLTFGLLSPNKGIEYVLQALPAIVKDFPDLVFIVVGQTHPNLLREEGEQYRLGLKRLAKDLGMEKHVVFFNSFLELDKLMRFIGATDIYITPYLSETQITSGTLAYAFGTGNAVISTPYWHAAELLADNRGKLVPFRSSIGIEKAVKELLKDEPHRQSMRRNAYKMGRTMVWNRIAELYVDSFRQAGVDHSFPGSKKSSIRTLDEYPVDLPNLKLNHLLRMSDSTGIFQHARYTVPLFSEGYCTDDNARALLLTLMLQDANLNTPEIDSLCITYMAFLNHAYDRKSRRFRNFLSFDRKWIEEKVSEDCSGRALWALGYCVGHSNQKGLQMLAAELFEHSLPEVTSFTSPRAWAYALLGINEYLKRLDGDRRSGKIGEILSERLVGLYRDVSSPDWSWFETALTYGNAKMPHALIVSGRFLENEEVLKIGYETLRWLLKIQSSESGSFRPVGSYGFYSKGTERALYDQQPIEAHATLSACIAAYFASSGESYWIKHAGRTFDWFLGRNDLGQPLYDVLTGGCRDGLQIDRTSGNEGAESTLSYLLSLVEMKKLQGQISSFK
ncbi:glycosyltransferase family 4 protein [Spirochaeta isovalerica]|uniref:Glycosyltransferase involved in cell wall biosynthesis n=1 Tax=Spirochaeta isovalerica TaxID=150 RepID=A0A841R6V9_9SPIO|nr:glycosyltransferase family 4 protein [Spirochaeta isovalerica]MBB6480954.1 glycosyltransferase involved in cell wall biosynthesis [Spirochaeta isovalerica]